MGAQEDAVVNSILQALSKSKIQDDVIVWVVPTGGAYLADGSFVRFGLCVGGSDLIGIKRRLITQDDVGKTIGQFVGIEVKTEKGKVSKEQSNFLKIIGAMNAIAGVARNAEQAMMLLGAPLIEYESRPGVIETFDDETPEEYAERAEFAKKYLEEKGALE